MLVCDVFGMPQDMPLCVLPTYENIMKFYLLVKHEMKPSVAIKEPTIIDISEIVAQKVEGLWTKSTILITSHTRVSQMIRSFYDKYINIK